MNLPSDPIILLSYVNTKLRDQYPSLESLCEDLHTDEAQLRERLAALDYRYDSAQNKFI